MNNDQLHEGSFRLSVYRAIASPVHMVHVTSDPILTAFCLTEELADNAAAYRHLAAAYLQVADDVSAFAVDLLGEDLLLLNKVLFCYTASRKKDCLKSRRSLGDVMSTKLM